MSTRHLLTFILLLSVLPATSWGQAVTKTSLDADRDNPSQTLGETSGTLRVRIGKTTLLKSPQMITRISISDPAIASATSINPYEVMIHGTAVGSASLILWTADGREQAFDLEVEFDLPGLRATLERLFPSEPIEVIASGRSLVLSGNVSSEGITEQALAVAQTQTESVVNLLQQAESQETVLLQVRFAEVDRSALRELGINIFSTGGANTIGSVTTQQFGQLGANAGAVPAGVQRGGDPPQPNLAAGGIGNPVEGQPAVFGMSDLLNIFLFRPDINLGTTIRALEQRNLLQILAEPNILARDGAEARFLAGGEFPFPVVQATTGGNAISILFKEFGVRLLFTPQIQTDGRIRLRVAPEVSALDFANALTISGFLIPALSTRRSETEVDLRDGQTFAIAGLIDNRTREVATKVPLLGDIPILGNLFRSRAERQDSTELVVIVTPRIVQPLEPGQLPELPDFPSPFLDGDSFDGPTGEAPPAGASPNP